MPPHAEFTALASTSFIHKDAATVAINLRRLMARAGLTLENAVTATELDERTLRGVIRGTTNPHARTLHKLALGLGVEMDELFRPPGQYAPRQFDRATNTLVEQVVAGNAELFMNWSEADFDELFSRFGTGGQLTPTGIVATAQAMNAKRDVRRQVSIILESGEAELLSQFVSVLYGRVTSTVHVTSGTGTCVTRPPVDTRPPRNCSAPDAQ
jgi:transcriptional regulator with XRE-family HTH domain